MPFAPLPIRYAGWRTPRSKLWIEDKQYSLSIHHRGVHHMERTAAHTLIGRALEPLTAHLRMLPGHEVWEILPHEIKDKGAAVRHRIALLGDPSAAIYIGDDVMDETAFRAMPQGLTIRVGRPSPSHAQYRLADVRQVAWFLDKLKNEFVNRKGAGPKASSSLINTKRVLEFRNLDAPFPQTLVVFLARILHDFPIRTQNERPRILPRLGEGFGIVDGDLVRHMA